MKGLAAVFREISQFVSGCPRLSHAPHHQYFCAPQNPDFIYPLNIPPRKERSVTVEDSGNCLGTETWSLKGHSLFQTTKYFRFGAGVLHWAYVVPA